MNIRLLAALSAAVLTSWALVPASAQQPPSSPAPAAPKAAPPKAAPPKAPAKQPAAPAPAAQAPAAAPAAPGQTSASGQGAQFGDQPVQLMYTPWTKVCFKAPEAGPKDYCLVGKSGLLESGQPVITGLVVIVDGEAQRILRVTFPPGVLLPKGNQIYIDNNVQQQEQPFFQCLPNGCYADYPASNEMIAALKAGQNLVGRAYNANNMLLTMQLPIGSEFAKAFDGPATDPKAMEQQQKDMESALQKRAEEARKRLQEAGGSTPAPAK
jgi:invasion protein IalB